MINDPRPRFASAVEFSRGRSVQKCVFDVMPGDNALPGSMIGGRMRFDRVSKVTSLTPALVTTVGAASFPT